MARLFMDHSVEEEMTVKDSETLPLYNLKQKETVDDVTINQALTVEQQEQVKKLLMEVKEIFSDVPKVTHLIEHKVELTEKEPVKQKPYPTPYKMQEVVDKEIAEMLKMGIIEHIEAPYASLLVLVKKSDGTYKVCVNFKELNKITVFDPEPMMSPDGDSQEEAFTEIKHLLSNEPILKLPDLEREYILQIDASNLSLGACLLQQHGSIDRSIQIQGASVCSIDRLFHPSIFV